MRTERSIPFVSAVCIVAAFLAACSGGQSAPEVAQPAAEVEQAATEVERGADPAGNSADPTGRQPATKPYTPPPAPAPPPAPKVHALEPGMTLAVQLAQDVTSEGYLAGDPVSGEVVQAVTVDGHVMIPAGSEVRGTVLEVKSAKRFGGQAMVSVQFTSVDLRSGRSVPVNGILTAYAKKQKGKDTGAIAGGAAGGAILGKVLGGDDKDAAIGAVVGGAIGTAVASRKGEEAFLPIGSETTVVTQERFTVQEGR